jgi:transcription termination factor Rho
MVEQLLDVVVLVDATGRLRAEDRDEAATGQRLSR